MSLIIDKQTRDLINRLNKADQDILKLKASINKILNKSTSLVATGSFGSEPSNSHAALEGVQGNGPIHLSTNERQELNFFNGTFLEKMTGALTQSGTNIRLTIGKSGGGDLTARFSSGYQTISDNSTIDLPEGTDSVPIKYFVFVLESTGNLTSSTVDFPTAEHAKICTVLVPTAAFVAANSGAYHFQLHNDESMDENKQGHYSHQSFRTRVQGAKYLSGIDGAGTSDYLTIAPSNVEFKSSLGVVSQMHPHSYGAKDTSTGTIVLMANDATTPYNDITDLFSIVTLKDGSTAWGANKWIKLVFFGSANKSGTFSPIFCNKPSGQENSADLAREDNNNYADFDIPAEFLGTGFLICSIVVQKTTTWGYDSTQDLREGLGAGGGGGGHVKYTDAEVTNTIEAAANAAIATGDSLVFVDVTDGVLKQDLVSDLIALIALANLSDVAITGTQLEDLLLFKVGNSAFIPCAFEFSSLDYSSANITISSVNGQIRFGTTVDQHLMLKLPLTTIKNSHKLYVDAFRVGVFDADASSYVTQVRIFGILETGITELAVENTDRTAASSYTTTFTPVDCSSYDSIAIVLNPTLAVAGDLDISGLEIRCYYDT